MDSAKAGSFFHDKHIAPGLIYATGDRVCENERGEIEFRGRVDNQIKVRGYRVSLEEVQSNILKLNKVNEALVLLNKFDCGDQQLVAYLQLQDDHELSQADIKKTLALNLPKYMIPDLIHLNKELPICKNGKIDRKHASIAVATHTAYNNTKIKN
jgi:acyl-coenzyme A synthetase/AMP-(fatty) acid ligase